MADVYYPEEVQAIPLSAFEEKLMYGDECAQHPVPSSLSETAEVHVPKADSTDDTEACYSDCSDIVIHYDDSYDGNENISTRQIRDLP